MTMIVSADHEAQFERVYLAYSNPVLAYALRRTTPEAAADVVAETFLVAWRRLTDLPKGAELPWLYGVARRILSTQRRSNLRQQALVARIGGDVAMGWVDPETEPGHALEALANLEPGDREVVLLAAWEELDSREAASVLGCSPTAYRIRLHRARKRLRAELTRIDRGHSQVTGSRLGARPEREGGSTW
jgi:DNA-directed RNA polymerase specialized sigma24 family protein